MSASVTVFDGWDLDVAAAEEPRVRDVDVAKRGGLAEPRNVRRIIEKNWDELTAHGEIRVMALSAQTSGGRPGTEYWLTEAQAVALVSMMRTPTARALRVALVKLFVAYRRGQIAAPPAPLPLDVAHGARVGDLTTTKKQLADECTIAANASGRSLRAIHGYIRKCFGIPGIHHLSLFLLPNAVMLLKEIATKRLVLPTKPRAQILKLVARDPKQVPLPLTPPS